MIKTVIRVKAFAGDEYDKDNANINSFAEKFNMRILQLDDGMVEFAEQPSCVFSYDETEHIMKDLFNEVNSSTFDKLFRSVSIFAIHYDEDGFVLKREMNEFGAILSASPNWLLTFNVSTMRNIQNEAEELHRRNPLNCKI